MTLERVHVHVCIIILYTQIFEMTSNSGLPQLQVFILYDEYITSIFGSSVSNADTFSLL